MTYCEDCSSYNCGCPEWKEIESLRQQLANSQKREVMLLDALEKVRGHGRLYNLFSCVGSDSYDPECADLNAQKCRSIAEEALAGGLRPHLAQNYAMAFRSQHPRRACRACLAEEERRVLRLRSVDEHHVDG